MKFPFTRICLYLKTNMFSLHFKKEKMYSLTLLLNIAMRELYSQARVLKNINNQLTPLLI